MAFWEAWGTRGKEFPKLPRSVVGSQEPAESRGQHVHQKPQNYAKKGFGLRWAGDAKLAIFHKCHIRT